MNTVYKRYKYNENQGTWLFEYDLNNSSFTAAQWATVNSTLTAADKSKLDGIEQNATKNYANLDNKPSIGGVTLSGDKSLTDFEIASLSDMQSAKSDINSLRGDVNNNTSAVSDLRSKIDGMHVVTNYGELDNKPQINGQTLSGSMSLTNLGIASNSDMQSVKLDINTLQGKAEKNADDISELQAKVDDITVINNYGNLSNKPQINNVELSGNKTLTELGIASSSDMQTAKKSINTLENNVAAIQGEFTVTSGTGTLADGISGESAWYKYGRIVQVWFSNIRNNTAEIKLSANIMHDVPPAIQNLSFPLYLGSSKSAACVVVSANGYIRLSGLHTVAAGDGLYGTITYISAS